MKFANGVMICVTTKTEPITTSESHGAVYTSPTVWIPYPQTFIAPPESITPSIYWSAGRPWMGLLENNSDETQGGVRIMGSGSTTRGRVVLTVIGRWK